jgi:TPR repeat protein
MFRRIFILATLIWASVATAQDVQEGRTLYLEGKYTEAFAILDGLAEAGDPVAQNILGVAFSDTDRGKPYEPATALVWLEAAAAQDFDRALYNLALFWTENHPNHPNDYVKARNLYEEAAALGNAGAMNNLGVLFEEGRGGPADIDAAFELYRAAAKHLDPDGQNNLANFYRQGLGTDKNLDRAFVLFRDAALQGHSLGLNNLAVMHEQGLGTARDEMAAYALYLEAFYLGEPLAAYNLAYLLTDADAYFNDPTLGYAYCLFAIDNNVTFDDTTIETECAILASELTEAELSEAQALYETF